MSEQLFDGSLYRPSLLSKQRHVDYCGPPTSLLRSLQHAVQPLHYRVPRPSQVAVEHSHREQINARGHPIINTTNDPSDVCAMSNTVPPSHVLCTAPDRKPTKLPEGLGFNVCWVAPRVLGPPSKLDVRVVYSSVQNIDIHPFPCEVAGSCVVGVQVVVELIDPVQSPGIEYPSRVRARSD